ncbi:MAG TPA: S1 RNA-binding domain-containing protein [Thermogutta sp.]|nr:S1 RNA-binding domain-containing protein [Thermogutta sp.]
MSNNPQSLLPPDDQQGSSSKTSQPASETNQGRDSQETEARPNRPRILIGSQRDPAAYRPRPGRPLTPFRSKPTVPGQAGGKEDTGSPGDGLAGGSPQSPLPAVTTQSEVKTETQRTSQEQETESASLPEPKMETAQPAEALSPSSPPLVSSDARLFDLPEEDEKERELDSELAKLQAEARDVALVLKKEPADQSLFNRRLGLPPDLEKEYAEALGDVPVEELIQETSAKFKVGQLEPESRHVGKVLAVRGENVFVELGLREQGIVPLRSFREPPEVGQSVEVRVVRFVPNEGIYELVLPAAAADVADWADLSEGMIVEARVTGVNQGGLECEVNRIRGFIPISQIDIFRVEKPEEYVGQVFTCVVLEADAQRKNLVLSRRAILEREREQAQRLLWDSLAPGQVREGVVRKLMDFGAFIDLGGVDGLLHVSQLAWGRVKHPSEILREGQTVRVRIDKVDRENRRISLGYRDLISNPWEDAEKKYVPNSVWRGTVTRLMDFGAFVELEPGVEGLVHISELALKRVSRVSDVVKEGDVVDVMVLSFDPQERRISLSIRAALKLKEAQTQEQAETAEAGTPAEAAAPEPPPAPPKKRKPTGPLKGGLGSAPSGGGIFGLKW